MELDTWTRIFTSLKYRIIEEYAYEEEETKEESEEGTESLYGSDGS